MINIILFPNKKYSIIYAEPPWAYRQCGATAKSQSTAKKHYPTMTTDVICVRPILEICSGDGVVCFMWAASPNIPHQIIEAPFEGYSKEPGETRSRIADLLGDVPRIGPFARQQVYGWDAWGNEVLDEGGSV